MGAAPQEDDGEPFQEKMTRLTAQWREQQVEAQQTGRRDCRQPRTVGVLRVIPFL